MINQDLEVYPLHVVHYKNSLMCARLKVQILNVTTYSKKKSLWQSYGSFDTITDESFLDSLFWENKQCELMCKNRGKLQAIPKPFSDASNFSI